MSRSCLAASACLLLAAVVPASAAAVPAPPGTGNYCSITSPSGGWGFASSPSGGDPCGAMLASTPGGVIQRKGLYSTTSANRVVYRCYPPNYGWVGVYQGTGNAPLSAAYDAAQGKPGCVFNVSRRAYRADLQVLQDYLRGAGQPAGLPIAPSAVAAFVAHEAFADPVAGRPARAIATIERHLRGISAMHRDDGHDDPTKHPLVQNALRGARRHLRGRAVARKDALRLEDLEQMLRRIPATNIGRRDRALLLLGLAGALRRSEIVALDAEDISATGEGILVQIQSSKTDQTAVGFTIPIARGENPRLCAASAVQAWKTAAAITTGPLFVAVRKGDHITTDRLSDKAVARIIKARAQAVGLSPSLLAGHSLRAGGITQAKRNGYDEAQIARLSGHKNIAILRTYLRSDDQFEGTAQVLRSDRDANRR